MGTNNSIHRTFTILDISNNSIFLQYDNATAIFDATIFRASFDVNSVYFIKSG